MLKFNLQRFPSSQGFVQVSLQFGTQKLRELDPEILSENACLPQQISGRRICKRDAPFAVEQQKSVWHCARRLLKAGPSALGIRNDRKLLLVVGVKALCPTQGPMGIPK